MHVNRDPELDRLRARVRNLERALTAAIGALDKSTSLPLREKNETATWTRRVLEGE